MLYLTSAGILSAIQTKDGSLLWHTNTTVALDPSVNLIADDHHVYLPYLNSILAMDTTTGKISWDATLPGNERAKSMHIDGNILAVQTDRRMLAFNTQNGHRLWQKKVQVVTANIINDTLYIVLYNTAQNSNGSPGIQARNNAHGEQSFPTDDRENKAVFPQQEAGTPCWHPVSDSSIATRRQCCSRGPYPATGPVRTPMATVRTDQLSRRRGIGLLSQ